MLDRDTSTAEKAREHAEACLRTAGDTSHVSIGRTHLEALLAALTASPAREQHLNFLRAARDSYDAGPDRYAPVYEQYGDLLTCAEGLALIVPPSQESVAVGAWLSAALDDPAVCDAMKADINAWFAAGEPLPPAQGEWISVPREPTEAMARALEGADVGIGDLVAQWAPAYRDMLAAAPVAPSSGEWIERVAEAICEWDWIGTPGFKWLNTKEPERGNWCTMARTALRALELPSTPKPQELAEKP